MIDVDRQVEEAVTALDLDSLRRDYLENDEFVYLERFLPEPLLNQWNSEADATKSRIHRNYVPGKKKGGSVGFDTLETLAPTIRDVYRSPTFLRFIRELVGASVQVCPPEDLHACALYCYTEPGDHIGYHYDKSYYLDRRYTVLIGVRDSSASKLVYQLHTRNANHGVEKGEVSTGPGCLVVFNGDKLLHKVTPLGDGEERVVVTMEYVTNPEMNRFLRFVSNMKDAIAYFGFRKVFRGARRTPQPVEVVR